MATTIRDTRLFTILPEFMIPLQEILALEAESLTATATIQSTGQTNDGAFIVRAVGYGATVEKYESILLSFEKQWDYIPTTRYGITGKSKHLGEEGKRIELDVDFYAVGVSFHPKYGIRYYYRLSHSKNELVWVTNKKMKLGNYRISGLVKKHSGVMTPQTILSHCKVVEKKVSNAEHKHKRRSAKRV